MSHSSDEAVQLALEVTPTALSLITFCDDIPLECLASVAMEDPAFDSKVGAFRAVAERAVGKGFRTHVWLSDEHVRLHCVMLRSTDAEDRREEAASALSAMLPYTRDELCFDLGAPDGEGYTPIAAIPKDKLDEALAFARKIQMNPCSVSTSDDVVGFAMRPAFVSDAISSGGLARQFRAAGIAALIALPILGFSTALDRTGETSTTAGHALVATLMPAVAQPDDAPLYMPGVEAPAPRADVSTAPLAPPALDTAPARAITGVAGLPVLAVAPDLRAPGPGETGHDIESVVASLPVAARPTPLLHRPIDHFEADLQPTIHSRLRAPNESPMSAPWTGQFAAFVPAARPDALSVADRLNGVPTVEAAVSMPVLSDVQALSAVEFAPVQAPVFAGVQVANVAQTTRPDARTVVRRLQPGLTARPAARPGPALPEDAFDFATLVPMTAPAVTDDVTALATYVPLSATPELAAAPDIVASPADAPVAVTAEMRAQRMAAAERRAIDAGGPLARLAPPPTRDSLPGPTTGAIVQAAVTGLFEGPGTTAGVTAVPMGLNPVAVAFQPAVAVSRPVADGLPQVAPTDIPGNTLSAALRPPRRAPEPSPAIAEAVASVVTPSTRPPLAPMIGRPALPPVGAGPGETAIVAAVEAGALTLPRPPARQAELATAALASAQPIDPGLVAALSNVGPRLTAPPDRPKRFVDLAAMNNGQALFASAQAVPITLTPISRPGDLASRAAEIRARRGPSETTILASVDPAATTPSSQLRIPTSARVARAATVENGINLNGVSLIGIFGTSSARRALVRLPQGRYIQVKRGDRVSGWTVAAISEDAVQVQRGNQNGVLRMPQ